MTYSTFSRRQFLSTGTAALGLATCFPASSAFALSQNQARTMVDSLVGEINRTIDSGKSENAMIGDFEKIFLRYADTSYVAAYAMGNDGRRASTAQRRAFSQTFNAYVARKYGKRFREFIGGRLEVQDVRQRKNYIEVTTIAFLRGQSPFEVAFHISDRSGQPKFINMYIEGINMLLTERAEVGAMLDKRRGDIDAMIADLKRAS
ncbi:phospholipid-binding protein MlaC [Cognatishimia sp. F0-27]|uniref:MlaC/ttg2D family ABC transporter substrate-binding protein n=1 Tax=Cognatishimia sp. F0-27 TaxID=2816855 RepID=UPI001D0C9406|nr:ABC transporter substrate-binding protein [Cognatishimia sp. F0-27]MCC1491079.1 ABC transporter substrate-binding protein [Cognatishimia sp. F0-27]